MKKLFFIVFITFFLACNNQEKLKISIQTIDLDWEKIDKDLSELSDKANSLQEKFQGWQSEMEVKQEWRARLGDDQIAQLTKNIHTINAQNSNLESLRKKITDFVNSWNAKRKVLENLKTALAKGKLTKDAPTKVAELVSLLTVCNKKVLTWNQTLAITQTRGTNTHKEAFEVIIKIDPNLVTCNGQPFHLTKFLNNYAKKIESNPDKWLYSHKEAKDCSGMFLRLCEALEKKNCENYIFPSMENNRDTRLLAGWFHENGNLRLVRDAENSGEWIQPGMVMFYGYKDKLIPENFTPQMLRQKKINN